MIARASAAVLLAAALLPAAVFSQDAKTALKNLRSGNPRTRVEGAAALSKSGDKTAAAELVAALRSEKNPEVRIHLAESLGAVGGGQAAAELAALAKGDPSEDVRAVSCLRLGLLGDKAQAAALREIALDGKESRAVRLAAANGLALYLDEPGAGAALEELLSGKDKALKAGALDSLAGQKRKPAGRRLIEKAAADADQEVRSKAEGMLKEEK